MSERGRRWGSYATRTTTRINATAFTVIVPDERRALLVGKDHQSSSDSGSLDSFGRGREFQRRIGNMSPVIKAEIFDELNDFNESFAVTFNDVDLCRDFASLDTA